MKLSSWLIFYILFTSFQANARHFFLTDAMFYEGDTLITKNLFFKTHKKSNEEYLHRKSIPFLDSLVAFMRQNKEIEIEIIRFHSPIVRGDYVFLGGDCKPSFQLNLIANYVADWKIAILRMRIRDCQDLPIAKDFEQEKWTILRITKVKEEDKPIKKRGKL